MACSLHCNIHERNHGCQPRFSIFTDSYLPRRLLCLGVLGDGEDARTPETIAPLGSYAALTIRGRKKARRVESAGLRPAPDGVSAGPKPTQRRLAIRLSSSKYGSKLSVSVSGSWRSPSSTVSSLAISDALLNLPWANRSESRSISRSCKAATLSSLLRFTIVGCAGS